MIFTGKEATDRGTTEYLECEFCKHKCIRFSYTKHINVTPCPKCGKISAHIKIGDISDIVTEFKTNLEQLFKKAMEIK